MKKRKNSYGEKLRKYVSELMENPAYENQSQKWSFGAIDFAYYAGLIDLKTRDEIFKDYELIEQS